MNRRPFLQALVTGGALPAAGCVDSLPFTGSGPKATDVFEDYWYEETDLVVRFHDDADVERVVLFDSSADETYETIERPANSVRFPVVFPDQGETRVTQRPALRVKAETPDGWTRQSVWEPIHGAVRNVEPLADGRARLEIENQTPAPLLVGFVAIYGDVPNPTIDPQDDSIDRSSLDLGPGVVGLDENRPLSPSRTDLVVPPEETKQFETTYAPFAHPDDTGTADCTGDERTGKAAIVYASGGSAAYGFTYRLAGEPTELEGLEAAVCDGSDAD